MISLNSSSSSSRVWIIWYAPLWQWPWQWHWLRPRPNLPAGLTLAATFRMRIHIAIVIIMVLCYIFLFRIHCCCCFCCCWRMVSIFCQCTNDEVHQTWFNVKTWTNRHDAYLRMSMCLLDCLDVPLDEIHSEILFDGYWMCECDVFIDRQTPKPSKQWWRCDPIRCENECNVCLWISFENAMINCYLLCLSVCLIGFWLKMKRNLSFCDRWDGPCATFWAVSFKQTHGDWLSESDEIDQYLESDAIKSI